MGFDLNTAKPVAATAPPAPARGGFDLASARPVDAPNPQMAGVPGYDGQGRPEGPKVRQAEERPTNGVDVLLGRKGAPGAVFDAVLGVPDAVASAGSAMAGGIIGSLAGVGKSLAGGKFGTQQGAREGEEFGSRVAEKIARPPATATGRAILEGLGHVMEPLAALPSAEIANLGRAASSANTAIRGLAVPAAAVQDAADAATLANGTRGTLRELVTPAKPALSGVGAARATEEAQRVARAQSLPVPVKLTKGQRTSDFDQVAFEQEVAKQPEGAPLRNRAVEQNQQLLQNFDAFHETTGAQAYGLRATGRVVDAALVNKYEAAKSEVRAAYSAARDAGEMAEPVPYKGLADYLEKHSAEIDTNNVPMLAAVRAKLAKLDPEGTGVIPLNDMEELRKMAGRLTTPGTPNEAHIGDVKRIIDGATENAGGDLYREARRLNTNMARQFENAGAVDKLLRTKRGSSDRAVAVEDIADHIIDGGSVDDTRWVRRVLTAGGGEEGAQAWKEVQGAAVNKLRDAMFPAGVPANTAGDTVARFNRFDKLVKAWDDEGRLKVLFGKQGASQVKDFAATARDILTTPEGTRNTSNTASALLRAFDKATAVTGSVPGLTSATKFVQKKVESAVLRKRVDAAVNPDKAK
jgi:hypothetical protein